MLGDAPGQFVLHIFLSSIESETRLFKEAAYTLASGICRRVVVLGLWRQGLRTHETTEYGLEIYRLETFVRGLREDSPLKRSPLIRRVLALFSLIQYSVSCVASARKMRPNHISCHNSQLLPVAWAAARLSGATLEYLPHELETQRAGLSALGNRLTALIERLFIGAARNVVVVCDPIADWYRNAYGLTNVRVVRNVPERDAARIRSIPEGGFRQRFDIPAGARIFIYQGLFSAGRGIELLLETFGALDPSACHLVLMGYGDERYQSLIHEKVRQEKNIHYQSTVPRELIVSYSACADVGIFISEQASLSYRYALPNKFFEWAHAGLPILVSDNLEYQGELLREGGFGWAATLEDLAVAIRRISQADLAPYIANARRYSDMAVWEEDAKVFAQIYERTLGRQGDRNG
jgi:glycosyltransferase involved in cell wall biosynthesis